MCQIIYSADGAIPEDLGEILKREYERNRHGTGILVHMASGEVFSNTWFKQKESGWSSPVPVVKWLQAKLKHGPIKEWAIHCRLATHGSKSGANCHPFTIGPVSSEGKYAGALMHNGIFNVETEGTESDTARFARGCDGKDLAGITSLWSEFGGGSRVLVCLLTNGEYIFTRLGSWDVGHGTTNLYFSSTPAFSKYIPIRNYSRMPYANSAKTSNATNGKGHADRDDFESWRRDFWMREGREEVQRQLLGDHELVFLPEGSANVEALPAGIARNTDGIKRQEVIRLLDKASDYQDLENTLIGQAHKPGGILPTCDAAALYILRMRTAMQRLITKWQSATYHVKSLTHQLEAAQKVKPAEAKSDSQLQADYAALVAQLNETESEVKQADAQIDWLMADAEVSDRVIDELAGIYGDDLVDGIIDYHRCAVEEEYPSYAQRPQGLREDRPVYDDRPEDTEREPTQAELDALEAEVRAEAKERIERDAEIQAEVKARAARDVKGDAPAIIKSIAERDTVKVPKEMADDAPELDPEQEALDALAQETASSDASYEG
jgi:hypothetical protein